MTGNLTLDIIIVAAALLAIVAALYLGGVVDFSGFGFSLKAGRNSSGRKTELLKKGRVEGKVGKVVGHDETGAGAAAPGDISIGEGMVVSSEGQIDEIVGARIRRTDKDGGQ